MLSVVIATHESERLLVPTLAALVPGATAGLVREVIVTDAGSQDATAQVADVAGCRFVVTPGPLGARLRAAVVLARAHWLMFLRPGAVLDVTWIEEVSRFIREAEISGHADYVAVFRSAAPARGRRPMAEALMLVAVALGVRPRPAQGLLIARATYDALGGHHVDGKDPERDFIRRLNRRQIVLLRSSAVTAI